MKKIYLIPFLVSLFLMLGCGGDENSPQQGTSKYTTDKMLIQSTVEKVITPEVNSFYDTTVTFEKVVNQFIENTTEDNLKKVQNQWLLVAQGWAKCYAFNVGDVKKKFYRLRFADFPVKVEKLEEKIAEATEFNEESIKKMSTNIKGIYGIEYLLFNGDDTQILSVFIDKKYKTLLKYMTVDLVSVTNSYKNDIAEYAKVLIEAPTKDGKSTENPLNIMFNGLNNVVHYAWETKIGKVAGYEKTDYVILDKIQAPYSKQTLAIIKANIAITKQAFFNSEGISIADKIKFITKNDELNNQIKQQYENIEKALVNIDTLYDAVESNNEKVKKLYDEVKRLEILFSTDVLSTLSLIITGTDGDGD